jgi:hypothetical protein
LFPPSYTNGLERILHRQLLALGCHLGGLVCQPLSPDVVGTLPGELLSVCIEQVTRIVDHL